ncbi:MAG: tetratricopeptide repeat protein [Planctomycetes bacterium]|nr:tetratricopeptide repeat protein [Planctomycetota bacterium]
MNYEENYELRITNYGLRTAFSILHSAFLCLAFVFAAMLISGCGSTPVPEPSDVTLKLDLDGVSAAHFGDSHKAEISFRKSLEANQGVDSRFGVANAYINLGELRADAGEISAAEEFLTKAIEVLKEFLYNPEGLADLQLPADARLRRDDEMLADGYHILAGAVMNNLGGLRMRAEKYVEAKTFFDSSLSHYDAIENEDPDNESALIVANLGALALAEGDKDGAITNFERSIDYHEDFFDSSTADSHKVQAAAAYVSLGSIFFEDKNYVEAIARFNEALALDQEARNQVGIAEDLHFLAVAHRENKDSARAISYFHRAYYVNVTVRRLVHAKVDLDEARALVRETEVRDPELAERIQRETVLLARAIADDFHDRALVSDLDGDYARAVDLYLRSFDSYRGLSLEIDEEHALAGATISRASEIAATYLPPEQRSEIRKKHAAYEDYVASKYREQAEGFLAQNDPERAGRSYLAAYNVNFARIDLESDLSTRSALIDSAQVDLDDAIRLAKQRGDRPLMLSLDVEKAKLGTARNELQQELERPEEN